jgi:hypothetical protein
MINGAATRSSTRLGTTSDLPARLRTFLDAYGLPDRKAILPALQQTMSHEPGLLRWLQHVLPDLTRAL